MILQKRRGTSIQPVKGAHQSELHHHLAFFSCVGISIFSLKRTVVKQRRNQRKFRGESWGEILPQGGRNPESTPLPMFLWVFFQPWLGKLPMPMRDCTASSSHTGYLHLNRQGYTTFIDYINRNFLRDWTWFVYILRVLIVKHSPWKEFLCPPKHSLSLEWCLDAFR